MQTRQKAESLIEKAKLRLIRDHRFYAYNLSLLKVRERPHGMENNPLFQTMCTDAVYIFYNPEFVVSKTVKELTTILAHEILHVLSLHGIRGRGHDIKLSCLAADLAINPLLLESGFEPVENWAFERKYVGMNYEQIYRDLVDRVNEMTDKKQREQDEQNTNDTDDQETSQDGDSGNDQSSQEQADITPDGGANNASSDDSGNGNGKDETGAGGVEPEIGQSHGQSQQDPDNTSGNQNSNAGSQDSQSDTDDSGEKDSTQDSQPSKSPQELRDEAREQLTSRYDTEFGNFIPPSNDKTDEQQEREMAQRASRAQNNSRLIGGEAGSGSPGLERIIYKSSANKLPWHAILMQEMNDTVKNDYNFMVPSRRYLHTGFCLPSLHSDSMGNIGIFVDTSMSIDQTQLAIFGMHINSIMQAINPESLIVIYCDNEIPEGGIQTFYRGNASLKLKPKGGGGTDFRPPFEYIQKKGIDLRCAIYFTDLQCSDYPQPPAYPTYWIRYGSAYYATIPPFGKTIGFGDGRD